MRQERFSPSTNVSGWKGRQDYLKGYPGAAMSDALNGGFAGGGGYVFEDSYQFFAKGSYSGRMNIQNIPQTHRHLHIDFTNSNQTTYWGGIHCLVMLNQPSNVQPSQPNDGNWDGMKGFYYRKGWSNGTGQSNTSSNSSPVSEDQPTKLLIGFWLSINHFFNSRYCPCVPYILSIPAIVVILKDG